MGPASAVVAWFLPASRESVQGATNFLSLPRVTCLHLEPTLGTKPQPLLHVELQCHLLVTRKPADQAERKGKEKLRSVRGISGAEPHTGPFSPPM